MMAIWIRCLMICAAAATTPAHADDNAPATSPTTAPTTAPVEINAADAQAVESKLGGTATVVGTVASIEWSRSGRVCNIEFEGNPEIPLMACIFSSNREAFDEKFEGDIVRALAGKRVRVTATLEPFGGMIQKWLDRTQMILDHPDQIELVD